MLDTLVKKFNTEENIKKDFKKVASYVIKAKGSERSIGGFAGDCGVSGQYMESVIKGKINCYPQMQFLKVVSDNSEGRVSFKDLTLACGYSNYCNNDLEQIKNIKIERGGIYFCNFGDSGIDSEITGHRPVCIIQNSIGNARSSNTKVLTITSRSKAKLPTHIEISSKEYKGLTSDSIICCEVEDTVSKRRLISGSGVVEKIAQCSPELLLRISVAVAKADGIIDLNVPEKIAIEALMNLNRGITKTYQFENNRNLNTAKQSVFA